MDFQREQAFRECTPECPVVVVTDSVHQLSVGSRCAGYGTVPAVSHAAVHVPGEERLEAAVHLEPVLKNKTPL